MAATPWRCLWLREVPQRVATAVVACRPILHCAGVHANALVLQMLPTAGCGNIASCAQRDAAVEQVGAADQERFVLRVDLPARSTRAARVVLARV